MAAIGRPTEWKAVYCKQNGATQSLVDVVQSTELEWPPMCYDLPECRDGWPSSVYEWNTWFRSKKGVSGIYQKLSRATIISPQRYDRENKMSIREPTPHVHTSTRPHHVASQTSGVNFLQSPTVRLGGGAVEPKLNFAKLLGRSNKLKKMRGQNAKQETSKWAAQKEVQYVRVIWAVEAKLN